MSRATQPGCDMNDWPPRPKDETFPPLLDTVLVGQLLLYDRRGMTVEQGRRNVRKLVHEAGLPTMGRVGSRLLFRRDSVFTWLGGRGVDDGNDDGTVLARGGSTIVESACADSEREDVT